MTTGRSQMTGRVPKLCLQQPVAVVEEDFGAEDGDEGGLSFLVTVIFLGILEKKTSCNIQYMPKENKKKYQVFQEILETMKPQKKKHLSLEKR